MRTSKYLLKNSRDSRRDYRQRRETGKERDDRRYGCARKPGSGTGSAKAGS